MTAAVRMSAAAVPGLGRLLGEELAEEVGAVVTDAGHDGRADVVLFEVDSSATKQVLKLDMAEDVFVEVGRTLRGDGDDPKWIARRLWRPERVTRAVSTWTAVVGRPKGRISFRVIVRVLQERSFLRTDLRRELTKAIEHSQGWKVADPARLEVWVVEYQPGKIVAGLRLSDVLMRQHSGREVERTGALRPTVAAAMVRLAGPARGRLLVDPCCGSGTILAEAARRGWRAQGGDIDPDAVAVARRNVRAAQVEVGDARSLPLADGSAGAVVSNLPFGQQFTVGEEMTGWQRAVLAEAARVTQPGGRVVVLVPRLPRAAVPPTLRSAGSHRIRLLGTWTRLWCYDRTDPRPGH